MWTGSKFSFISNYCQGVRGQGTFIYCDHMETSHEMMQVDVFMRHFVDSTFAE